MIIFKKLKNIKVQTSAFNNMSKITEIIEEITGSTLDNSKLDIDENLFLIYTYVCLESGYWNNEKEAWDKFKKSGKPEDYLKYKKTKEG